MGGATRSPAHQGQSQLSASGQEAAAGPSGPGARLGTHAHYPGALGEQGGARGRGAASGVHWVPTHHVARKEAEGSGSGKGLRPGEERGQGSGEGRKEEGREGPVLAEWGARLGP